MRHPRGPARVYSATPRGSLTSRLSRWQAHKTLAEKRAMFGGRKTDEMPSLTPTAAAPGLCLPTPRLARVPSRLPDLPAHAAKLRLWSMCGARRKCRLEACGLLQRWRRWRWRRGSYPGGTAQKGSDADARSSRHALVAPYGVLLVHAVESGRGSGKGGGEVYAAGSTAR